MKKAFVFIDGNNLYFRVKSVAEYYEMETGNKFSTINFKFKDFCKSIVADTEILEIRYYVG